MLFLFGASVKSWGCSKTMTFTAVFSVSFVCCIRKLELCFSKVSKTCPKWDKKCSKLNAQEKRPIFLQVMHEMTKIGKSFKYFPKPGLIATAVHVVPPKRNIKPGNYLVMRSYIKSHQSLQEHFRCFVVREQCVTVHVISDGQLRRYRYTKTIKLFFFYWFVCLFFLEKVSTNIILACPFFYAVWF